MASLPSPDQRLVLTARPRRLRRGAELRSFVRETRVALDALIQPLFIDEQEPQRREITSMPGIARLSLAEAVREAQELYALGIHGVLLFGIPAHKDAIASSMTDPQGIIPRTIAAIKQAVPQMLVIADLCACEYTTHGHCGLLTEAGSVDNDPTVALLARTAVLYAQSGADVIAPSDMMDGRIGEIRRALDLANFTDIAIFSYAVKYASAFYGPFREAADSAPSFGDRRSYQMDIANRREAIREAELDSAEGADVLIIKPAMAYLDIVRDLHTRLQTPLAVYSVSGEYAMVKAAAQNGWIDEARIVDECFTAFVRAGASIIISYFAKDYAKRIGDS